MSGESVELSAVKQVAIGMLPYERLLGDAIDGDATLFTSEDAVEAAWRVVDPILERNAPVVLYEPGTWGPVEASALTARVGGWHDPRESSSVASERPA
jgi:glucose-6-phosphate 1-dehydrogenase